MAVASLTRMTVPLASDQSASNQGLLMPKLKYRFRVVFENFGVSTPRTELTKQVVDFKRPSLSFEDIILDVYNSNDPAQIALTIQFDNANQGNQGGGGIGNVIGRTVNDVVTG